MMRRPPPGAVSARLRRLHLIIVHLCHPRKVVTKSEKYLYRHMLTARDTWAIGTTPIPLRQNESWRCRYSFGYGLDDSDKPVFLLWPERTEHNGFGLIDVESGNYQDLSETPSIQNLGLEHFYAAFGLKSSNLGGTLWTLVSTLFLKIARLRRT